MGSAVSISSDAEPIKPIVKEHVDGLEAGTKVKKSDLAKKIAEDERNDYDEEKALELVGQAYGEADELDKEEIDNWFNAPAAEEDKKEEASDEQPQEGEAAAPAEGEAAPAEGEAAPAEGEAAPAEGEAAPAEGEAAPAEGEAAPAEGEAAPAEGEAAPAEGEAAPAEGEAAPAEGEAAPAEE